MYDEQRRLFLCAYILSFFIFLPVTADIQYQQKLLRLSQILQDPYQFSFQGNDVVTEEIVSFFQDKKLAKSTLLSGSLSNLASSQTCVKDIISLLNGTISGEMWALRMADAFGKFPSAFLNGDLTWLGAYDECVNETAIMYKGPNKTDPVSPFKGHYCRVGLQLYKAQESPVNVDNIAFGVGELVVGVCVPSSCSESDINTVILSVLGTLQNLTNVTVPYDKTICQKEKLEYSAGAIIVLVILSIFIVLMILGTLFDVIVVRKLHVETVQEETEKLNSGYTSIDADSSHNEIHSDTLNIRHRVRSDEHTPLLADKPKNFDLETYEPGVLGQALLAFSVYTNGSKLLSTKQQSGSLRAVNGIRFISLSWVILGHAYAFAAFTTDNLLPFIQEMVKRWTFQALLNATVAVDTFFVLSGLLLTYLSLRELKRMGSVMNGKFWGLFYFHRFWRLTPPYMLIIMLYVPLFQYWWNGPVWPQGGVDQRCETKWWQNILYINNFFPNTETCMAWSWYLANDMQFYVISPLILIPLYYSGLFGGAMCLLFLLISWIVSGVLTTANDLPISIFTNLGGEMSNVQVYFDNYYIRPYCRIGPYIIGMFTGYILHKTECRVRMSKWVNLLGWVVAAGCCLSVLYGPYDNYNGRPASTEVVALYNAVARSVWGLGVGWVIFACATGYGGMVNGFLSWEIFVPLGRLTYCAYLIHPVLMEMYYNSLRKYIYMTDLEMVYLFFAHIVTAYAAAFVISLAFESPFMGLEKAILKREKRS